MGFERLLVSNQIIKCDKDEKLDFYSISLNQNDCGKA